MQSFRNILFVSRGFKDDTEALKQALSLARNNEGALTCLVACPEVPKGMIEYQEKIVATLREDMEAALGAVRGALKLERTQVPVAVVVETGDAPVVRIIQRVLRESHDLIVKDAEPRDDQKGYGAFDMHLLRKCPCPVWMCRPISKSRNEIRVGVAVDPESQERAGHDLSLRLLTLARSLADTCNGELEIISCWDFEYEGYLRHSPWGKVPEVEVQQAVAEARDNHHDALEALVEESGIVGTYHVHHFRGQPDKTIPHRTEELGLDILVMGTVARTGIAGFFIGNTAENVLQEIRCSLLALKPPGFASPVKAY